MTGYLRAKRDIQTVFLYYDPAEMIDQIAARLPAILEVSKPVRLNYNGQLLDGAKTAQEYNLENDAVVYFVFPEGDGWEEPKIPVLIEEEM